MEKSILGTNKVVQIGIVVRDVEKTAKKYAEFFGVAVPEITESEPYSIFRGNFSHAQAKLAFFHDLGSVEIELIQPDEQPSTWREFLDTHGEGVHHLGFVVKNIRGKSTLLQEKGMELVHKGEFPGGYYTYMDGTKDLKTIIELVEKELD